jgi:hypothetical protein
MIPEISGNFGFSLDLIGKFCEFSLKSAVLGLKFGIFPEKTENLGPKREIWPEKQGFWADFGEILMKSWKFGEFYENEEFREILMKS